MDRFLLKMSTAIDSTQFEDPRDAEDAVESCDGKRLYGYALEVQFAKGDRKSPGQMRGKDPVSQRERYRRRRYSRYVCSSVFLFWAAAPVGDEVL